MSFHHCLNCLNPCCQCFCSSYIHIPPCTAFFLHTAASTSCASCDTLAASCQQANSGYGPDVFLTSHTMQSWSPVSFHPCCSKGCSTITFVSACAHMCITQHDLIQCKCKASSEGIISLSKLILSQIVNLCTAK